MIENIEKDFSILCNLEGSIIKIIQNNNILSSADVGNLFFTIVATGEMDKIINFFLELKSKNIAEEWEININTQSGVETFWFSGRIFNDIIGIAAATSSTKARNLFLNLNDFNYNQASFLNAHSQENIQTYNADLPTSYYDELSHVNNELVNIQRELSKKNSELSKEMVTKDKFFSIIAHDLRSPFNSLLGFIDLLVSDYDTLTDEECFNYINILQKSTTKVYKLLENLLEWARLNKGDFEIHKLTLNLKQIVEDSISPLLQNASKKNLTTHINIPSAIFIYADLYSVMSVVRNLFSNAVKYTPVNGVIEINCKQIKDKAEVCVKDNGIGMKKEVVEKLFHIESSRSTPGTENEKGTGLGLLLCKEFVTKNEGKIYVKSEVNFGSEFYFTVPLYKSEIINEKSINLTSENKDVSNKDKKLLILIAEDDETSTLLISASVKSFTDRLLFAINGLEAVENFKNNPEIDLILMDLKMPYLSGYEATKQIRELNKDVIIIAQTAYALSGEREKAIAAGCNDFITKPINYNLLMAMIGKYF